MKITTVGIDLAKNVCQATALTSAARLCPRGNSGVSTWWHRG
jgi:hypothetical protein